MDTILDTSPDTSMIKGKVTTTYFCGDDKVNIAADFVIGYYTHYSQ